jgi:choline dehydrogenase-like flavoprotein
VVLGTGIEGVHVVDASTMPLIGPETRMVLSQLIGEKGSDVILR